MSAMTYCGYEAMVEKDHDEEILMGYIAGLEEMAFCADSFPSSEGAFRRAVDDFLEWRDASS